MVKGRPVGEETKSERKARLIAAGMWNEFGAARRAYKLKGHSASDAERCADADFAHVGLESAAVVPADSGGLSARVDDPTGILDQVSLAHFEGKRPSTFVEDIFWVYKTVEIDGIGPDDCPSPGAWGLRSWARQSLANKNTFYGQILAKLIPSRSRLDQEGRYEDDGREQLRILDAIEAEMADVK